MKVLDGFELCQLCCFVVDEEFDDELVFDFDVFVVCMNQGEMLFGFNFFDMVGVVYVKQMLVFN